MQSKCLRVALPENDFPFPEALLQSDLNPENIMYHPPSGRFVAVDYADVLSSFSAPDLDRISAFKLPEDETVSGQKIRWETFDLG